MYVNTNPLNLYDIAPYSKSVNNNMPPSYNPINSSYFSYVQQPNSYAYSYNLNGTYIGQMTQPECEKQCLIDMNCNGYSLLYPNNPTTNDINKYRCYLTKDKYTVSADGQGRGIFNKKSNSLTNIKNDYRNNLYISDDYELLPNTSNNIINLNTMCRGTNFNSSMAKRKGYMTPISCALNCSKDSTCTGFDIARPDSNGNYDCYNFNINNGLYGESNNTGDARGCFKNNSLATYETVLNNIKNNLWLR